MEKSKTFKDLIVWQKAHKFVLDIYQLTKSFPKEELFCLTNQIRRSAISIAANIVEGYRKSSKAEKARYFNIAEGSIEETKYFLILAKDLGYAATDKLFEYLVEISKLLSSYKKAIISNPIQK
ncbi:MAG: four helix bundle protein [Ignavibacteria bacterium]|nr:four helix bundle protein [Ignavibacteria bacterium]